jgi:hypothetical protein
MTEIRIEDLRREHLKDFWFIEAIAGFGDGATRVRVWESNRLLPFVDQNHAGTEVRTLFVRVASLDEADLQPLNAKIEQLREGTEVH